MNILKLLTVAIITLTMSCGVFQKKCPENKLNDAARIEVVDKDGKVVGKVPVKDLKNLHALAGRYVAMMKNYDGKVLGDKDVTIVPMKNDRYGVKVKLDDKISINIVLTVKSDELVELRRIMNKLKNEEPNIKIERLGRDRFNITMSIENIKWQTEIEAENLKKWSWNSFWAGIGASGVTGLVISAIKAKGIVALLPFLL